MILITIFIPFDRNKRYTLILNYEILSEFIFSFNFFIDVFFPFIFKFTQYIFEYFTQEFEKVKLKQKSKIKSNQNSNKFLKYIQFFLIIYVFSKPNNYKQYSKNRYKFII